MRYLNHKIRSWCRYESQRNIRHLISSQVREQVKHYDSPFYQLIGVRIRNDIHFHIRTER